MKIPTLVFGATTLYFTSGLILAQDIPRSALVELKEAVKAKDESKIPPILDVASRFQKSVKGERFEAASDVIYKILASEEILGFLTNEVLADEWSVNSPEVESVLASIHLFIEKTDAALEEGYQWQPVTSNVRPPPGTPNAAAGMNPDAIKDPVLRQKYLESIKKNQANGFKNSQQSTLGSARAKAVILALNLVRWAEQKDASKAQILDKLAPEGKSKSLLRDKLAPPDEASHKGR